MVLDSRVSDQQAKNARVPQGSVLSATLLLLHIIDMLALDIVVHAINSTVVDRYLSNAKASRNEIQSCRESTIDRLNLAFQGVSKWGGCQSCQV